MLKLVSSQYSARKLVAFPVYASLCFDNTAERRIRVTIVACVFSSY